jgi:galactokinase
MQPAGELARHPERLADALVDELRGNALAAEARAEINVVRSPGRVNLIGEHTDYNAGLVLPVAIDLGISIAFVPWPRDRIRLTLAGSGERLDVQLDERPSGSGGWRDYVLATAWAVRDAGGRVAGFTGLLAADLPVGAGLSSSAALEIAVAWALGGGAAPLEDRLDLAKAARDAENAYVGVPAGLMDPFAVTFGVGDAAILLDCRNLEHRIVPLPTELRIVIAHSGVSRQLGRSEYASRRAECERAVADLRRVKPDVSSLRDVSPQVLGSNRNAVDPIAFRRARHVVTENERVTAFVAALESDDRNAIGTALAASHASLRDDFEVSTSELDQLVEIASSTPGVVGARLTGAGFGGATVNLVTADATAHLVERLRADYRTPAGEPPRVWTVRASAGAGRVWPLP